MDKFIDIRSILREKNEKLLNRLPSFVISYLERILHQEEINNYIYKYRNCNSYEFCKSTIEDFNIRIKLYGKENLIPYPNPCYFVGNHPLGGFDALALVARLQDVRPDIKFIVNDFLLHLQSLKDRFVGVSKVSKTSYQSLQKAEKQFASNDATFIFPAGLVSRKKKGIIRDQEWKKTIITKSKKYKKPLIPIYFHGKLTDRFYRLSNIRSFLRIKINIEMLYLVDELFKQKNTELPIVIGKPISFKKFTNDQSEYEWAQWLKEETYALKDKYAEIKGF